MKRILILLALALGALLALGACGKPDVPSDDNGNGSKQNLLDLLNKEDHLYQDLSITSKHLSRKMTYSVWLPNEYDETKTYPFLYLLHGYETGDQAHLDRCWVEKGNARAIAQEYLKNGGVPMVIVMPNGLSMFYSGAYEPYLHEELMPEVEKLYHGNGKRAIAGLSMGGYGTLYHALKYPSKFTYAYAMSPAVRAEMVDLVTDPSILPGMTIETGNQDDLTPSAAAFVAEMKKKGVEIEYITRDGFHYWNFWQECLPKALKKVGESFTK